MKKMLALFLAIVFCFSITACGSDSGASGAPAGAGQEPSTVPAASAAPTASTEGKVPDGASYKIGVVIPLSGDFAFFSSYFSPILDIYIDNLNEAGGINGHKVELLYKDNQGNPTITAQRLDELLDENVSAVIGPFMDTCGPAAAQWATENKVPVVMCCALSTEIGMANASDYVFCAGSSAWAWAKVFANAVKDAGYQNVYYVGNEGGVPDDVYNFFWEEMAKLDSNVKNTGSTRLSGTESDLSSVITSVMSSGSDAIVTSLTGGGAITFIQQGSQFGLFDNTDLFGVYIAGADHTESIGANFPVGKIWSIDWFPIDFSFSQDWAKEIYEAAGQVIPNGASLNFYYACDAVCQALAALDFDQRTDSEALVAAMETVKIKSPIEDTEIYFTDYSHQLVFPMYFCGTAFSDGWNGIALCDESDYKVYGAEVYPTKEEWTAKAAELGYQLN